MSDFEEFPDELAREMATKALKLIETHLEVCLLENKHATESRSNMAASLQRIESTISVKVKEIYDRMWNAVIGFIGALFVIIMLLVGILLKH